MPLATIDWKAIQPICFSKPPQALTFAHLNLETKLDLSQLYWLESLRNFQRTFWTNVEIQLERVFDNYLRKFDC